MSHNCLRLIDLDLFPVLIPLNSAGINRKSQGHGCAVPWGLVFPDAGGFQPWI